MKKQSGNFLLQALLALALIVAFMPFFVKKLAVREQDSLMFAVTSQIETAQNISGIYVKENINIFPYNITVLDGDAFADALEPYGLPLGFIPKTAYGQDIKLVIDKNEEGTATYLDISGGTLTGIQKAEIIKRIGFYASQYNDSIIVTIPFYQVFSNLVKKNNPAPDESSFLSDLDMGGFTIESAGALLARNAEFETMQTNTLSLFGVEADRKIKNKIDNISSIKSTFQSNYGEPALILTRGNLNVGNVSAQTISRFGTGGNLNATSASVKDFNMTAGSSGFTGPSKWEIKGNAITDRISFSVEKLEINSFVNAARGQNVFIEDDEYNEDEWQYLPKSGIEVGTIALTNITLRDQTSSALNQGKTGTVILDIRPAGTSVLPDIVLDKNINGEFKIIAKPENDDGETLDCKNIISSIGERYNQNSISQNIICQYVFWQRLERRIDIKQCMLDGRSNCDK